MKRSRKKMPKDMGKIEASDRQIKPATYKTPSVSDIVPTLELLSKSEAPSKAAPSNVPFAANTLREMCEPTWTEISQDLKHSANMWDIMEVRDQENEGINEVRRELEKIKFILEKNEF